MPELIHGTPPLAPGFLQGFQCHIQTDLVSVFKAICHRFCRIIYSHFYAFNGMLLNAGM
jgi:hypothetical protein